MKQMTCAQMGGPATCTTMISGNSADEMVQNGWKHVEQDHPEMFEKMKDMSKESQDKWQQDFLAKYNETPEQ